jgi:transmembrane sensor
MSQRETSNAEAARWDARLRACDCTDTEREAFAAWRSRPDNDAAYTRLQAALTLLRGDGMGAEMIKPRRDWGLRRVSIGLAASFAAALLIGGWLAVRPTPDMTVSAPAAAERSIRFADGSAMLLAPGSTMKLHYAGDTRGATLISGSARLMLAPDQRHPFILYAADRRVTTTGSELSVGLSPGRVRIGLLRGAARVHCWHGLLPSDMSLRVGQRIDAEIGSDHARLETIT